VLTIKPTVFIFTTALFLSGYVLQQQTVRDLRAAIKPQLVRPAPGPELYLPPQFRDDEYWEARGVVDSVLGEIEKERMEKEKEKKEKEKEMVDDEDMVGATRWQKAARRKQKMADKEEQKPIIQEDTKQEEEPETKEPKPEEKPMSRAERRRRIKEQILAEGEGEGFKGYRRRLW
jgi:primosomal protein N'